MANQITSYTHARLSSKLKKLEEELPRRIEDFDSAYKEGDTSDNADFDAARDRLNKTKLEISNIRDLLQYEIIPYDKSDRITMGSIITIQSPVLYGGEPQTLILEEIGGTVIEGVLNINSPLGKLVKDNLSADYTVNGNIFNVRKERDPNLEEFMVRFPEEDVAIENLFKKIDE